MPDPVVPTENETATPPAQDAGTETPPATPAEGEPQENVDDLPEWARKALTKANGEAANYRTQLRATERALEGAKSPEEFEAALSEVRAENARLERANTLASVARAHNLPDDLAALVQGDDKEAMEAHAKVLQKYVTPQRQVPADLAGGLNPTTDGDPLSGLSPRDLLKAARAHRR